MVNLLRLVLIHSYGILTSTGWANAATVDVVSDLLHMIMMGRGRDDIPVGLGEFFALSISLFHPTTRRELQIHQGYSNLDSLWF